MHKRIITFLFLLGISFMVHAQYTVEGSVQDSLSLEYLPYTTILVETTSDGDITNPEGRFKFNLPAGQHRLSISYIGYKTKTYTIKVPQAQPLICYLQPVSERLESVVVYGISPNDQITRTTMGMVSMDMQTIRRIPAFLGEVDIIKAMQLLPGVVSTSEGSSGFSVRGGAPDQNLVMLENAPILSTSHVMGFFPLFNNDAIDHVTIYKGDIPVEYGSRLSSILDIDLKDGDMKTYNVAGGIGLLSARISIDGPIIEDKLSFLVSGRRSYFDLFLPLSPNEMIKSTRMYFWDLSGKLTYNINHKNRLTLSSYGSNDVMDMNTMGMRATYGNRLATMTWHHEYTNKWHSQLSANYINYLCGFDIETGNIAVNTNLGMQNVGLKYDVSYTPNEKHQIKFGYQGIFHIFDPGTFKQTISGDAGLVTDSTGNFIDIGTTVTLPEMYGIENALYVGNTQKIGSYLTLKYGLRASTFSNIGDDKVFTYDDTYNVTDTTQYSKGEVYHTAWALEPRIGLNVLINDANSIKMNYSRTAQYVQLAQNTAVGLPQDRWFSANPNLKPQFADMFALGYFRNFAENSWETSVELYYKNMQNVIDYKDYASLMINEQMYGELRTGKGWAYGAEFMVKRTKGDVTGWVSYTLSRAMRKIDGINQGRAYLAPYDRTHNLAVVLNYSITKRIEAAATWVYYTGTPYTVPVGKAVVEGMVIPIYSDRNAFRLPDYHRLDLSVTIRPKHKHKPKRKWNYDFNIGIYNVYNRHNAWFVTYKSEENQPLETYAELSYLFGIIPSVTFNFYF